MSSDPALWAAVVEERERALRVARHRCASRQDAEDCVQEAMVRVAGMDDVDLARVGALLTTVVCHLAVDTHRSRVRGARAHARLHLRAVPQPAVDERVCDDSEARWLWARRHELREQERRVMELRAEGLSVAQAATALGITHKAAEASFTRARSKLHGIWKAVGAALAVLWAGARRQGAAGTVMVTAAATVVAAVALTSAGDAPQRPPAVARDARPGPVQPMPLTPVTTAADDAAPPAAAPSAASTPPPTEPPALAVSPVAPRAPAAPPPPVEATPTPQPTPETLPQMVQRCVREVMTTASQGTADPPDCAPR